MPIEAGSYAAFYQRGQFLRLHRRFKEASDAFGQAIACDPNQAGAYVGLALALNDWTGHARRAMQAIDHAISLAPNNATFFGYKGWIYICQGNPRAALQAAEKGLAIDPVDIIALNARANAWTKLGRPKNAEADARRILELSPNDIAGLNLLAQSLRLQGRSRESAEVVARLLAMVPNDSFGHMTAGYSALEAGDHLRAYEHFLNSLRLDPQRDLARMGLLHSLRARVWIYRLQYRVNTLLRQPPTLFRVSMVALALVALIPIGFLFDSVSRG